MRPSTEHWGTPGETEDEEESAEETLTLKERSDRKFFKNVQSLPSKP